MSRRDIEEHVQHLIAGSVDESLWDVQRERVVLANRLEDVAADLAGILRGGPDQPGVSYGVYVGSSLGTLTKILDEIRRHESVRLT